MSKQNQTTTIRQVIKTRRNKLLLRKEYTSLFVRILFIVVVATIIFTQVFLITRITGNSMFPGLKDGDLAIVYRLQDTYLKDDVISYQIDNERFMGRIIAREGDVVNIDENGALYVNGTIQTGEILYPTYSKEAVVHPYTVPEDSVYVLGDYRTQTQDSRDFGAISKSDIEGKLITILRRRGI